MKDLMHKSLIFLAALLLAGCNAPAPSAKSGGNPTPGMPDPKAAPTPTESGDKPLDPENSSAKPNTVPSGIPDSSKGAPTVDAKGAPITPSPASVPIEKEQTGNWKKSTLDAATIAKNVSNRIGRLENCKSEAALHVKLGDGSGQLNLESFFGAKGQYSIAYGLMDSRPYFCAVRSDGKNKIVLLKDTMSKPMPITAKDASTQALRTNVVGAFPRDFSRGIYTSLTDGWDSWSQLIAAVRKPNSGYTLVTEERLTPYQGMNIVNYRLLIKRTPAAAKKFGSLEMEVVIDKVHWLPVTIRSQTTDLKGIVSNQLWASKWQFNVKNDPKMFELNLKSLPSPKAPN